jgi:hypothetical protein
MKLAGKFEDKLGLSSPTKPVENIKTAEVNLPKNLKKIAQAEEKIQIKMSQHREKFAKIAAGPHVQYSGGTLPALYHVCATCQGVGKLAQKQNNLNIKFASTEEYLGSLKINNCYDCKGKRVIKAVDDSMCSEKQLLSYAAEKADKDEKKKEKKEKKVKKKLEKLEGKAKNKKLALDAPEEYAKLKADKKEKKTKKKLEKQAKKAEKKVEKFKSKKKNFPFFNKKD